MEQQIRFAPGSLVEFAPRDKRKYNAYDREACVGAIGIVLDASDVPTVSFQGYLTAVLQADLEPV